MTPYFGPCRAGLHPEFGWGTPCLSDASEYVEVHEQPTTDAQVRTIVRLCADHATQAEALPGFCARWELGPYAPVSRRPLTTPVEAS